MNTATTLLSAAALTLALGLTTLSPQAMAGGGAPDAPSAAQPDMSGGAPGRVGCPFGVQTQRNWTQLLDSRQHDVARRGERRQGGAPTSGLSLPGRGPVLSASSPQGRFVRETARAPACGNSRAGRR